MMENTVAGSRGLCYVSIPGKTGIATMAELKDLQDKRWDMPTRSKTSKTRDAKGNVAVCRNDRRGGKPGTRTTNSKRRTRFRGGRARKKRRPPGRGPPSDWKRSAITSRRSLSAIGRGRRGVDEDGRRKKRTFGSRIPDAQGSSMRPRCRLVCSIRLMSRGTKTV